jgi:hypothetical protein
VLVVNRSSQVCSSADSALEHVGTHHVGRLGGGSSGGIVGAATGGGRSGPEDVAQPVKLTMQASAIRSDSCAVGLELVEDILGLLGEPGGLRRSGLQLCRVRGL